MLKPRMKALSQVIISIGLSEEDWKTKTGDQIDTLSQLIEDTLDEIQFSTLIRQKLEENGVPLEGIQIEASNE